VKPNSLPGLVWGIDGSSEMLDQMQEKPGGEQVTSKCGNLATATADGTFDIVVLLSSTIYAMPIQEDQITCSANAERHVAPGGRFVIEAWVPDRARGDALALNPRRLARGLAGLVIEEHDATRHTLSTTQVVIGGAELTRHLSVVHRYAWPTELDLMTRLNGMVRKGRWADWRNRPFETNNTDHISVWRKN
jgi:Methyltransferase domain